MTSIARQIEELLETGANPYRIALVLDVPIKAVFEADAPRDVDSFKSCDTGYPEHGATDFDNLGD